MGCEFKDAAGRSWRVAFNIQTIKDAKLATGVDAGKFFADGLKGYTELLSDYTKLAEVAFAMCREQAEKTGVTFDQFARSLDGDAMEGLKDAYEEAFIFFCPSQMRAVLTAARAKVKERAKALTDEGMREIESETFANSASNLPESSESTPAG